MYVAALVSGVLYPHGELAGDSIVTSGDDDDVANYTGIFNFYEGTYSTLYVRIRTYGFTLLKNNVDQSIL